MTLVSLKPFQRQLAKLLAREQRGIAFRRVQVGWKALGEQDGSSEL